MAQRPTRELNPRGRYISGSLAYDYDYLERERRRRAEREQREYTERRAREPVQRPRERKRVAEQPKHRERQHASPLVMLGFTAAAAMVVMLLMSYAQLTAISHDVVLLQRELSTLQDQHVELLGRYERTFDLAAVKEAAEAAGMAKPSSSQIYYVDLSAPDNVVLYARAGGNKLSRAAASMGRGVVSIVEYFK